MSEAALASGHSNSASSQMRMGGESSSSNLNEVAKELLAEYGMSTVQQAVNNAASDQLLEAMNNFIDGQPMPRFMKDDAKGKIAEVLQGFQSATPNAANSGTKSVIDGSGAAGASGSAGASAGGSGAVVQGVMDSLKADMLDESKKSSGTGGGGGGNWLAILARALGKTAGEHLKKMVELGEKMGELDSKEEPEMFAQIQSEFQAESQIFKMFQEAIGTMVKSIGEGMSTVARKQ